MGTENGGEDLANSAGSAAKKGAKAAGNAAKKVFRLIPFPWNLVIVGVVALMLFTVYYRTHWYELFLVGSQGYTDASDYAEVTSETIYNETVETVSELYSDSGSDAYASAIEILQPYWDSWYESITADNDKRYSVCDHPDEVEGYDVVTWSKGEPVIYCDGEAVESLEELFDTTTLADFLASWVLEYITTSQQSDLEDAIADGDEDLTAELVRDICEDLLASAPNNTTFVVWSSTNTVHDGYEWDDTDTDTDTVYGVNPDTGVTGYYTVSTTTTVHHIDYTCYNEYYIEITEGDYIDYLEDVDWRTSTEDDSEEIILALSEAATDDDQDAEYLGNEFDDLDTGDDGADNFSWFSSVLSSISSAWNAVSSGAATLSNALDFDFLNTADSAGDFLDIYTQQVATTKTLAPINRVTTLNSSSAAYATSAYTGQTAAYYAITDCRNSQYVPGGNDPETGVDCSGLVYYSYQNAGISNVPDGSYNQAAYCYEINQFWAYTDSEAYAEWYESKQPGDLLFYSSSGTSASAIISLVASGAEGATSHVSMYIGTVEDMLSYGVSQEIIDEEGLVEGVEYVIYASGPDADGDGDGVKIGTLANDINYSERTFIGAGRPYDASTLSFSGDASEVESELYYYFKSCGMTDIGACALLANIYAESGYDPAAINSIGATGLVQWYNTRVKNLVSYCNANGYAYLSLEGQASFAMYEMQTSYSTLWNHLKTCGDIESASDEILFLYEIPGGTDESGAVYKGHLSTKYTTMTSQTKRRNKAKALLSAFG